VLSGQGFIQDYIFGEEAITLRMGTCMGMLKHAFIYRGLDLTLLSIYIS